MARSLGRRGDRRRVAGVALRASGSSTPRPVLADGLSRFSNTAVAALMPATIARRSRSTACRRSNSRRSGAWPPELPPPAERWPFSVMLLVRLRFWRAIAPLKWPGAGGAIASQSHTDCERAAVGRRAEATNAMSRSSALRGSGIARGVPCGTSKRLEEHWRCVPTLSRIYCGNRASCSIAAIGRSRGRRLTPEACATLGPSIHRTREDHECA